MTFLLYWAVGVLGTTLAAWTLYQKGLETGDPQVASLRPFPPQAVLVALLCCASVFWPLFWLRLAAQVLAYVLRRLLLVVALWLVGHLLDFATRLAGEQEPS